MMRAVFTIVKSPNLDGQFWVGSSIDRTAAKVGPAF